MYKKCKVVMLATNDNKAYIWMDAVSHLIPLIGAVKSFGDNPKHLYILSDEEIKEGDWYLDTFNNSIIKANVNSDHKYYISNCKKIIASTDSSLTFKTFYDREEDKPLHIPSIPQSFIDLYVSEYNHSASGNMITEVMVEYVEMAISGVVPVIKDDNTINIKTVKDSWTREEVKALINKAYWEGYNQTKSRQFDKWIESNL